jgi:hypothetical protein
MMLRKSESWESAYTLLNWHLSLCQNYYDVNVCNEFCFCKKLSFHWILNLQALEGQ